MLSQTCCLTSALRWLLPGTYAGYMAVPDAQLARMPESLSFEQAGSMPLVALTAFRVQSHTLPRNPHSHIVVPQPLLVNAHVSSATHQHGHAAPRRSRAVGIMISADPEMLDSSALAELFMLVRAGQQ